MLRINTCAITRPVFKLITLSALCIVTTMKAQVMDPGMAPELMWTTVSGGAGYDRATAVASEFMSNLYALGNINGPQSTGIDSLNNSYHGGSFDAYITKYDRYHNTIWSTYLGGSSVDYANSIITTPDDLVIVSGYTSSNDMETGMAASSYAGGNRDAFCSLYDKDGNMLWTTYIGGEEDDYNLGVCLGADNKIYVCGKTASNTITNSVNTIGSYNGGLFDGYIAKIDMYGTIEEFNFIGGSGLDEIRDIRPNPNGGVYITGVTNGSTIFSDLSYNPYGGGAIDGYLASVDTDGQIVWAQYLGGSGADQVTSLDISACGYLMVSGYSDSGTIPYLAGSNTMQSGNNDVFVVAYSDNGLRLWQHFIAGSGADKAIDIHCDLFGNIYVFGETDSNDLPVLEAWREQNAGMTDQFLGKLNETGELKWLTYLGGVMNETAGQMSSDRFGKIMLSGSTYSPDYPMPFGYEPFGNSDAVITRFSDCDNPEVVIYTEDDTVFCEGGQTSFIAFGAEDYLWSTGDTSATTDYDTTMTAYVIGSIEETCMSYSNMYEIAVMEIPEIEITPLGPTTFCGEGSVFLLATGAEVFDWNDEANSQEAMILADTARIYSVSGMAENGCESSASIEIEFFELPECIMDASTDSVCVSGEPISLIGLPLDGHFIGPGIVGNEFHPDLAGGGIHQISYEFTDENGCSGVSAPHEIEVFFYPTVLFVAQDTICTDAQPFELSGEPAGGTFSGDGVIDNVFHPDMPGTGPQNITYTYVDSRGCINVDSDIIFVDPCIETAVEDASVASFEIYPNPAKTNFTIRNNSGMACEIQLYTMSGQLLRSEKNSGSVEMQVENLPASTYVVKIISGASNENHLLVISE